jgi:hypothetical protein
MQVEVEELLIQVKEQQDRVERVEAELVTQMQELQQAELQTQVVEAEQQQEAQMLEDQVDQVLSFSDIHQITRQHLVVELHKQPQLSVQIKFQ